MFTVQHLYIQVVVNLLLLVAADDYTHMILDFPICFLFINLSVGGG